MSPAQLAYNSILVALSSLPLQTVTSPDERNLRLTMTVAVENDTIELYEPVVIRLRLHAEGLPTGDDPRERSWRRRFLSKVWEAQLLRDGQQVASASLTGGRFDASDLTKTDFVGSAFGWLGNEVMGADENEFVFWDQPGDYDLVVQEKHGGYDSEPVRLRIVAPSNPQASRLFASGGAKSEGFLFMIEKDWVTPIVPTFERLAREFPETAHGQYAALALTLRRYRAIRSWKAPQDPEFLKALPSTLEREVGFLPAGHPFRSYAWSIIGKMRAEDPSLGDPEEAIKVLERECGDSSDREFIEQIRSSRRAAEADRSRRNGE